MDRKQKQLWIACLLLAVVIVVWIPNCSGGSRKSRSAGPTPDGFQGTGFAPVSVSDFGQAEGKGSSEGWGRNPFMKAEPGQSATPAPTAIFPTQSLSLNGILWDPNTPLAIIDNETVGLGDSLDGWEVVEIQKTKVILSNGKDQKILKL
jgi:hypothetical protein